MVLGNRSVTKVKVNNLLIRIRSGMSRPVCALGFKIYLKIKDTNQERVYNHLSGASRSEKIFIKVFI